MNLGALFLLLAVIIPVVLFISRPFLEKHGIGIASAREHELSSLLAERDRMITALQELDFDHTLAKIPPEDYPIMRADLLKRAAEALRRLDAFQSSQSADAESRVEAAVAARRADAAASHKAPAPAAASALSDDALEDLLAARRASARAEKPTGFCPTCGKPITTADKFCSHCGKGL